MTNEIDPSIVKHPDLSQITDYLFVSSMPKEPYAEHISSLGVRLIISMTVYRPHSVYRKPPFLFSHCPAIDFRLIPIPLFILHRGVLAAMPVVERSDSVLVHCAQGVHRSVAMACCVLIARGYPAEAAMQLVDEKRDKADPYAPHIRRQIENFEPYWRKHHGT